MTSATWGLLVATFTAAFVEFVEALTIVLAMGVTRGWRSALAGTAAALVALAAFTAVAGYSLSTWLPRTALQLAIGTLLLIFGLQWLRKAVLRSSGRKAMHDEAAEYAEQTAAAEAAGAPRGGIDSFGFAVSFKGVFLEGVEVVFIVITFGLNADNLTVAVVGAAAALVVVVAAGLLLHRPLSAIPEIELRLSRLGSLLFDLRVERSRLTAVASGEDIADLGEPSLAAVAGRLKQLSENPLAANQKAAAKALERLVALASMPAGERQQ